MGSEGRLSLEVRVLGPLQVVTDDGAEIALAARQRRLLAALVVGAGEVCSRDSLIEAVWNGAPPRSPRRCCRCTCRGCGRRCATVSRIRTDESGYALQLDPQCLDAARFERLLERSESEREGRKRRARRLPARPRLFAVARRRVRRTRIRGLRPGRSRTARGVAPAGGRRAARGSARVRRAHTAIAATPKPRFRASAP